MKKFKRFLYIFILITVVAVLAAVLFGCADLLEDNGGSKDDPDKDSEHVHTYETEWSANNEAHYHATTCGHIVFDDYEFHDLEDEMSKVDDGYEYYICKICRFEVERLHQYGEPVPVDEIGLCTEEANYCSTCSKCGHVKDHLYSYKTHDYAEWKITSDDVHLRTCKRCSYENTHAPKPVGGEITQGRDCTHSGMQKGYCLECRLDIDITLPALGHKWDCESIDGKYHSRTCARCGESDVATHSITDATERDGLFHAVTCGDCSVSFKTLHDFSDGDCVCGLSYVPSDGLDYAETDGGLNVVGIGSFSGKYLYIPSEHNGKAVVGIAAGAFSGASEIRSVYVPDSVTIIGEGAFSGCSSITGMRLPFIGGQKREATELHQYPIGYIFGEKANGTAQTFYDDSLTEPTQKFYDIPSWFRYIAVSGGTLLSGSLKNSGIDTVILESGVTAIEKGALSAYEQCLTVSDTVTKIADGVLTDSSFNWLHVDENNTHYKFTGKCFIDIEQKTVLTALPGCTIPNDGSVTKLGDNAFNNSDFAWLSPAQSLVIPSAITYIGEKCFYNAELSVTIESEGLTYIGKEAFRSCKQVQGFTVKVDSDVFIGEFALTSVSGTVDISCVNIDVADTAFVSSGITHFELKCGTASFGNRTFDNCKSLLSIRIDCDEVTIGNNFAYDCKKLGSVTISGLVGLGSSPFFGCYDLYGVSLSGELDELPQSAFHGCAKLRNVTLPSSLTKIGGFAFSGCSSLAKMEIPDSVTDIGYNVFEKCSALSELKVPFLPQGKLGALFCKSQYTGSYSANQGYGELYYFPNLLKKVTVTRGNLNGAFMYCTSLTEINLGVDGHFSGRISYNSFMGVAITTLDVPDGLELNDDDANFSGMDKLTTVVWRLNTDVAGPYFRSCPNVETLTITNGVTSIMPNAFYGLSGLKNVELPDSVTSVGMYAFGGTALTALSVPKLDGTLGSLFSDVEVSGSVAVTQETANGDVVYYIPKTLAAVTVGGNYIPQGAFMNCLRINSVTCTGDAIEIGDKAFFNCAITQFIAPSVYKVGQAAFQSCKQATKIELGNLTELKAYTFKDCGKLATLVAGLSSDMTVIPSGLFDGCAALTAFDIPSAVDTIGERAFAGTGIVGIILPQNITAINDGTFDGCAALAAIDIPAGVGSIGDDAFRGCALLAAINIPANVGSIGDNAFYGCTTLAAADIHSNTCSIGNSAFYGCTKLVTVVASGSIVSLGDYVFYGCSSLTTATLPGNYTVLNSGLFDGCVMLSELTISANIGEVESRALAMCAKLDAFDFSTLTDIGDEAFLGCTSLTTVTLPSALITIGKSAFSGCTGLTTVKLYSALATSTATQTESIFLGCTAISTVEIGGAVSEIPAYMFTGCSGIKSVAFTSAALKKIGEGAFMNTGLTALALNGFADRITIARRAFYGCTDVADFTMPSGKFTIGDEAFFGMNKPTELVLQFGDSDIVGEGAFGGWSSLSEITTNNARSGNSTVDFFGYIFGKTEYDGAIACEQFKNHDSTPVVYYIPDTLKNVTVTGGTMTDGLFSGLSGISKVVIGESVILPFKPYMFSGCTSLKTVTFQGNYSAVSIPKYMFEGCLLPSLDFLEKVTQVGEGAFAGSGITSVVMWNSYLAQTITIGDGAFENCFKLTSFTARGTAQTAIGQSAFAGCRKLKTFESQCTNNAAVGSYAFGDCSALSTLDLSKSAQVTLSDYALKNCRALTAIYLDNVTRIGLGTLSGCTGITELELKFTGNGASSASEPQRTVAYMYGRMQYDGGVKTVISSDSYYIPEALKKITLTQGNLYSYAFQGCVGATEITFPAPSDEIPRSAFQDCASLQSVTIGDSAITIGFNAFKGCTSLQSVTLDHIFTIDSCAFQDCTALRTVTFFSRLQTISSNAFKGCTMLYQITIPASVRNISAGAFSDCTGLKSVTLERRDGWYYTKTVSNKVHFNASDLTPSKAAYYLVTEYKDYNWTNSQA